LLVIANLVRVLNKSVMCGAVFPEREVLRAKPLERVHDFPIVDVCERLAEN
jgi:hypothetical protein